MQRIQYFLLVALLSVGMISTLFAKEAVLINFDQYEQKLSEEGAYAKERGERVLDENLLPQFKITVDDMKIDKWVVELNSSARSVKSKIYSQTKKVTTKGLVGGAPRTVLGARIHFPTWPFAAWARISPPFEFPTYGEDGQFANKNNGLVENTGDIYQLSVEVNGRNYNNAFIVRMKNQNEEVEEYFMGYLFFEGWRRLIWKNPHYVTNVDLREIMRLPLYPRSVPYKKLDSFVVYRHGDQWGGDFVIYVANVNVTYDLAILEEERDVDDEAVWKIVAEQTKMKQERERKLNAELLDLRRREEAKMHVKKAVTTEEKPKEGTK
ncbi:MAG: hypothetical protein CVV50_05235 [Spirochaetae bacterium HGW-Spirochaetae-6]|nr:MAG: hypothetical protein CVV50_05235 [Spirochaetae bacterium HGW-Spirochaetae-6]